MEQYRITKYRESKSKSFYEQKSKKNVNQSLLVWIKLEINKINLTIFYSMSLYVFYS